MKQGDKPGRDVGCGNDVQRPTHDDPFECLFRVGAAAEAQQTERAILFDDLQVVGRLDAFECFQRLLIGRRRVELLDGREIRPGKRSRRKAQKNQGADGHRRYKRKPAHWFKSTPTRTGVVAGTVTFRRRSPS